MYVTSGSMIAPVVVVFDACMDVIGNYTGDHSLNNGWTSVSVDASSRRLFVLDYVGGVNIFPSFAEAYGSGDGSPSCAVYAPSTSTPSGHSTSTAGGPAPSHLLSRPHRLPAPLLPPEISLLLPPPPLFVTSASLSGSSDAPDSRSARGVSTGLTAVIVISVLILIALVSILLVLLCRCRSSPRAAEERWKESDGEASGCGAAELFRCKVRVRDGDDACLAEDEITVHGSSVDMVAIRYS